MEQQFFEEQTFDKVDFTQNLLGKGEYEYCTFVGCDFSNCNLSDFVFLECEFNGCNLSLVNLTKTALRDCKFSECKMLGLHFEDCNEFGFSVSFNHCTLSHSTLFGMKIKKTTFANSLLHEVDFGRCNLSQSVFDKCDLAGAIFENTNIEKADFRTSFNFTIDPEQNKIKKAKFPQSGLAGLLAKYDIAIDPNI